MTYPDLLKLYPAIADLTREELAEFVYRVGELAGQQAGLTWWKADLEEQREKLGLT